MAEFFVDPYKKYYDTLQTMTDITSESTAMATAAGTAATSIGSVSSDIGSSDWKEQGVTILSSSTLSSLKSNIEIIGNNISNSLAAACEIAIGSMLPELENLKTEDENYEAIKKELNELVVPVQYDDEGNTTSEYRLYLSQKNSLEYKLSESERKCKGYQSNVDGFVSQIKAKDAAIQEIKKTVVTADGVKELTVLDYDANSKLVKVSFNGEEFYVVNTKVSVSEYAKYVQENGICQNKGLLDGQCMILSQYYAMDLMRGTFTSKDRMANLKDSPATRINDYVKSETEEPILEYIYEEAMAGRPTVLQVSQVNSYKGWRHLVTVVGFKSDVKSYKDLNPDNILVLDCVDGKIQTLGQSRSEGGHERRLFAQGGYYFARGATDEFLAKEVNNGKTQYA